MLLRVYHIELFEFGLDYYSNIDITSDIVANQNINKYDIFDKTIHMNITPMLRTKPH